MASAAVKKGLLEPLDQWEPKLGCRVDFDELVFTFGHSGNHGVDRIGTAFEDRISDATGVQSDRFGGIVVTRDDVVHAFG